MRPWRTYSNTLAVELENENRAWAPSFPLFPKSKDGGFEMLYYVVNIGP